MLQRDKEIACIVKERLAFLTPLVDFRVFGSRAKGTADDESDLDLFIEVEHIDKSLKQKLSEIVWDVGYEVGMVISPLFFSRYEIEKGPLRSSFIVESIMTEGIPV